MHSNHSSSTGNGGSQQSIGSRLSARLSLASINSLLSRDRRASSQTSSNPLFVAGADSTTLSVPQAAAATESEAPESTPPNTPQESSDAGTGDIVFTSDDCSKETIEKSVVELNQDDTSTDLEDHELAELLVSLMNSHNPDVLWLKIACIPNVIPRLVKRLDNDSNHEVNNAVGIGAARALKNLAGDASELTKKVADSGAIEIGCKLLQHPESTEALKVHLLGMFGNIATDCAELRDKCLEVGLLSPVLLFLGHPNIYIKRAACHCVYSLVSPKPLVSVGVAFKALEYVGPCVTANDDVELKVDCYWALAFICDVTNERIEMFLTKAAWIPDHVVSEMTKCLDEESGTFLPLLAPLVRIAGNIISGTETQTQVMINSGIVPVINRLLTSKQVAHEVIVDSCWLLSNIAAGSPAQVAVLRNEEGLFRLTVEALREQNAAISKEIIWVIRNLMYVDAPNCGQVLIELGAFGAVLYGAQLVEWRIHCHVMTLLRQFTEKLEVVKPQLATKQLKTIRLTFIQDLMNVTPSQKFLNTHVSPPVSSQLQGEPREFAFEQHVTYVMERIGIMKHDSEPMNVCQDKAVNLNLAKVFAQQRLNSAFQFILSMAVYHYDDFQYQFNNVAPKDLLLASIRQPKYLIWVLSQLAVRKHSIIKMMAEFLVTQIEQIEVSKISTINEFIRRVLGGNDSAALDFVDDEVEYVESFWSVVGVIDHNQLNGLLKSQTQTLKISDQMFKKLSKHEVKYASLAVCRMVSLGTLAYVTEGKINHNSSKIKQQVLYAAQVSGLLNYKQALDYYARSANEEGIVDMPMVLGHRFPQYLTSVIEAPLRKSYDRFVNVCTPWAFQDLDSDGVNVHIPNSSQAILDYIEESFWQKSVREFLFVSTVAGIDSNATGSKLFLPPEVARLIAKKWCSFEVHD